MALQGAIVEIAFTTTPFADPTTLTWTDVSAKAMPTLGIRRGRSYELTQMQPGTLDLTLDNASGDFDPDNASSTYYPHVKVGIPIRVRTVYSSTSHTLFYGFIESWQQSFTDIEFHPTVKVTASDGMKAILSYALGQGYTDMLVTDYGGTVGVANQAVWPWQGVINRGYYFTASTADVATSGDSTVTGVAETGLQLSGSSSYLRFLTGTFWTGVDTWLRLDTVPSVGKQAVIYGGFGTKSAPCSFGYGAGGLADDDFLSAWIVNYPANVATGIADPTSITGWTGSGTFSTAAGSSSNLISRVWLDTGGVDTFGATSVIKAAVTSSGNGSWAAPQVAATAGTAYTFSAAYTTNDASSASVSFGVQWLDSGGSVISSATLATKTPSANTPTQFLGTATAPANTTHALIFFSTFATTSSYTVQIGQLSMWAGTFSASEGTIWYAPGNTPVTQLLIVVASGTTVAPPGQSSGSFGWMCYAAVGAPTASTWFHLAVDSGRDNTAAPLINGANRMPSVWLNGATVRMWTPGTSTAGVNGQPISVLGAKFQTYSAPVIVSGTSAAASYDESYLGRTQSPDLAVTSTQASRHYNYGLRRHDFVAQDSGARVAAVLDSIGWPTSLRSIDTGDNNILAQLPDASLTGLSCIQDAVNVEGGFYYIAGDGTFTFWNQSHTAPPLSITIGDGSGEVPFQPGIALSYDDVYIYNHVELTQKITDGSGSTALSAQSDDVASQNDYGVRAAPATSAPWSQQSDMSSLADAIVTAYKQPATRVASVQVESVSTGTFASTLPCDLGDLVRVKIRPKGSGPTISVDGYVQGLSLAITDVSWLFTFSLSPTLAGH